MIISNSKSMQYDNKSSLEKNLQEDMSILADTCGILGGLAYALSSTPSLFGRIVSTSISLISGYNIIYRQIIQKKLLCTYQQVDT